MKSFAAVVLLCFLSLSGRAQAILTVEKIFFNFDTIAPQNGQAFRMKFTNTGNKPLVITNCLTSGTADACTWDKKAVAPGKDGFITYKIMASSCGRWNKPVTVSSNGGAPVVIHVKGFVLCPPAASPVTPGE